MTRVWIRKLCRLGVLGALIAAMMFSTASGYAKHLIDAGAYPRKYRAHVEQHANFYGVEPNLVYAIIKAESGFRPHVVSYAGAVGLMQIMPSTAKYYGIDDLVNPEKNLKAGTKHLKRLQKMFEKEGMDQTELIKFTLAAYTAGEGRIADCRRFAESKAVDNNRWDEIVNLIPLMREDSILEEESVKLGKFQGHETIAYVENIMNLYDAICTICPSI